ncbi:SAM-dependent methyltransferase [Malaciobacter canalis]|uniref:SAM-dependent methyltransferase n=1 Tax=Malaciobacter canalis TaxID=1912871 RepID=UPI00384B76B0
MKQSKKGQLTIVSAGVGDLDNITLKAYKTIKEADIFFTMQGDEEEYKELTEGKPIHKAGHAFFMKESDTKMNDKETKKGEQRIRTIVREAYNKGKKIVIIDNGDSTIFGPQIGFITEFKDLNPKIIPGISSFNAANALLQKSIIAGKEDFAGVTLTIGKVENKLIAKLAKTGSTVVFFMIKDFEEFINHLLTLYPANTSIAIVSKAGYKNEENITIATLETIQSKVSKELPFYKLVYVGNFLR